MTDREILDPDAAPEPDVAGDDTWESPGEELIEDTPRRAPNATVATLESAPPARFPQDAFNRLRPQTRTIFGCLAALLGSYLAFLTGVPLPWLLGALFTSATVSMLGFNLQIPAWIRQAGQTVAGFAVGVFFTADVGLRVLELGWLMVAGGVASILSSAMLSVLLARIGGCDRKSAFFAMMPGGLAEMAGLAHQFGANITTVSVSQSLRIVIILVTLPPLLTLFLGGASVHAAHPPEMATAMLIAGVALAALCSMALSRLGIFNAFLLGGLAVGIALGLLVEEHVSSPSYARVFAQVAIGVALGARFHWPTLRGIGARFLPATLLSTLLLICTNVAIAWAMSSQIPFPTAVLAASPGGIAEMSLTAEALNLIPPLVTAWHLVRIVLVALLTAPLFKLYRRIA